MKKLAYLIIVITLAIFITGCVGEVLKTEQPGLGNGWQVESSIELLYAENFQVDYYAGGYKLITIIDGGRFLIVPAGAKIPTNINADITILKQPLDKIYLVATSAMSLFDALEGLDNINMSGTKPQDWYIKNAKAAMDTGDIQFAGKYSAPDYELILQEGCQLAIQSSMINHVPQVREKLQLLGIPVLVDHSSYEKHPLARTEWIKLYAALINKEDLADEIFAEQDNFVNSILTSQTTGKTVAFFHISSSGYVVARKSGDYVTKMIELAGGNYIFINLGNTKTANSTVNLEMEEFYATAKEADYIIYNSTIGGEIYTLDELIAKNSLLKEFKAVQNGNVWCTGKNLFQETAQLGLMIVDIHRMLNEDEPELNYMHRLN